MADESYNQKIARLEDERKELVKKMGPEQRDDYEEAMRLYLETSHITLKVFTASRTDSASDTGQEAQAS